MEYRNKIINYLKRNRISTTEVADAMGKMGVLSSVNPVTPDLYSVGEIKCVFAANDSNYDIHDQVREVEKDSVVFVFAHNCEGRALFGSLVSKYILMYRDAAAIVVDGLVRDIACLKRERTALWSRGSSPLGCYNRKADPFPSALKTELFDEYEGGVAVCDDGGVVAIPTRMLNEEMFNRLQRIEMQEDIWFYCLDTLKWDTKKIVCEKAYLKETDLLSRVHIDRLRELNKALD